MRFNKCCLDISVPVSRPVCLEGVTGRATVVVEVLPK